jgi:hypothetical protein
VALKDLTVEQYTTWKQQGLRDWQVMELMYYSPNSRPLLTAWKRENGLLVTRYQRDLTGKVTDKLSAKVFLELKNKGLKNVEIAQMYSISKGTLEAWVRLQKKLGNLPNRRLEKVEWLWLEQLQKN